MSAAKSNDDENTFVDPQGWHEKSNNVLPQHVH